MYKNPLNNGINYQAQQVNTGFQPSTVFMLSLILNLWINSLDFFGKKWSDDYRVAGISWAAFPTFFLQVVVASGQKP